MVLAWYLRLYRSSHLEVPQLVRPHASAQMSRAGIIHRNIDAGAYTDTLLISRAVRQAGFDGIMASSVADPKGAEVLHIFNPKIIGP
jgi:hypothetical protein